MSDVQASCTVCPLRIVFRRRTAGVWQFVPRHQHRAERTERIEHLAAGPLRGAEFDIMSAHVVGTGIARHVGEGILLRNVFAPAADHHGQLSFIVDLLADARQHDRLPMADERCGGLDEKDRVFRNGFADLREMRAIVQPHADHLSRPPDRREEFDIRERVAQFVEIARDRALLDKSSARARAAAMDVSPPWSKSCRSGGTRRSATASSSRSPT